MVNFFLWVMILMDNVVKVNFKDLNQDLLFTLKFLILEKLQNLKILKLKIFMLKVILVMLLLKIMKCMLLVLIHIYN